MKSYFISMPDGAMLAVRSYETRRQVADIVAAFLDNYTGTEDALSERILRLWDDAFRLRSNRVPASIFVTRIDGDYMVHVGRGYSPAHVPPQYHSTGLNTVPVLLWLPGRERIVVGRYLLLLDQPWRWDNTTVQPVAWWPMPGMQRAR